LVAGVLSVSTHIGINLQQIRRFNTDCFVSVIDLQSVRVKLTHGFASVTNAAVRHGATLAFNGGGWALWPNPSLPNEYLVIEGRVIQHRSYDGRPCIEITRDNKILFHDRPNLLNAWNIFGFDRFIARHSIFNSRISDRTSSAPRTVYGADIHGNLVVMVCEGRQPDQKGLTFPEIWEVMQEFNVTDCGNADGGNSSAIVLDGQLLNTQYKSEYRRVVHQVLFFADGEPPVEPPTGGTMDRYKLITSVTLRPQPAVSGAGPQIPAGAEFESDSTANGTPIGTQFVKYRNGSVEGWLILGFYGGKEYARKISEGETLPTVEYIEHVKGTERRKFVPEG
jgi:hypothetical protein